MKKFPFQQGDLDYLCTIYAYINLLHYRGSISDKDEAYEILRLILLRCDADPKGHATLLMTEGLAVEELPWIANILRMKITKQKGAILKATSDGILVHGRFQDGTEHSTLIVSENGVPVLFDSYGYTSVSIDPDGQVKLDERPFEVESIWS